MLDLTWKLFTQTGNIETYLLLKELEEGSGQDTPTEEGEDETTSNSLH